ncbi:MAG: HD domain-containing protein [Deltaproteobacteria bacterium]|nr:HD domain-containing protein [Deltaproteobacteria bacterium]MDL1987489.1 HD domain-containing protein [Deltaproteobacteria bacterium]
MNLLKNIEATNKFRDPLYGYIWLTDDEVKIVDTPIFQRLRRIQQLALTKYVFPTAEHSRFVHSLGVLQSATNIFQELLRKNQDTLLEIVSSDELNNFFLTLRFTALLHDIGHLPFSHACEKALLPDGIKHEHVSQYIVLNHPVIKSILEKNEVKPAIVSALYKGYVSTKFNIIKKVISGIFDADRADYLLRDSYNCGVTYGSYDYIRYVSSFNFSKTDGKDLTLTIEEGNIHVLESFLLARYHYNMQVPFHRTRTGLDRVLEIYMKYLESNDRLPDLKMRALLPGSNEKFDLERFTFFDDYEIFQEIKDDFQAGNIWAKILLREDYLIPVFDRSGIDKEDLILYADYILMLKDEGLREDEHFITYKKEVKIHDLISGSDEKEDSDGIKIKDKSGEIIGDFIDRSPVLKSLQKKGVYLLRVYVLSDYRDKAIKVLGKFNKRMKERKKVANL